MDQDPPDGSLADMGAYEMSDLACEPVSVYDGRLYWPSCTSDTWRWAETSCAHFGGHLASVTDAPENAFVRSLLTVTSWLGGSGSSGAWIWSDSEPWGYENWETEPGDEGTCLTMLNNEAGTWSASLCNCLARPFVCEK